MRDQNTILRKDVEGAYLYEPDSGKLLYINSMGLSLYELCDGAHTRDEIVAKMEDCYDAPMNTLRNDVIGFLDSMAERSFIKKIAQKKP
jgi:hypothetical protein